MPLLLDLSRVKTSGPMAFCLDQLVSGFGVAKPEHIAAPAKTAGSAYKKKKRAFTDAVRHRLGVTPKRIDEIPHAYTPEAHTQRPSLYLQGYWQNERYFRDYAGVIRGDINLPMPNDSKALAALADHSITPVSLHVRRGDYVGNNVHPCCPPEYYGRAADYIAARLKRRPVFLVFSDDLPWVQDNIRIDHETIHVNSAGTNRNYEDMALMATCQAHIVANSSFSWWGAWLNPDPDKIVVAPDQWFGGMPTHTLDIVPEDWTILSGAGVSDPTTTA